MAAGKCCACLFEEGAFRLQRIHHVIHRSSTLSLDKPYDSGVLLHFFYDFDQITFSYRVHLFEAQLEEIMKETCDAFAGLLFPFDNIFHNFEVRSVGLKHDVAWVSLYRNYF